LNSESCSDKWTTLRFTLPARAGSASKYTASGVRPVKRAVRSARVVELEVTSKPGTRSADGLVRAQIHFLVLHRFPQSFDEHVVAPAALAVHADRDAVLLEDGSELQARELTPLDPC